MLFTYIYIWISFIFICLSFCLYVYSHTHINTKPDTISNIWVWPSYLDYFLRILSAYRDKMTSRKPRPLKFKFKELQAQIRKTYRSRHSANKSRFPTFPEFIQYVIDSTGNLTSYDDWKENVSGKELLIKIGINQNRTARIIAATNCNTALI